MSSRKSTSSDHETVFETAYASPERARRLERALRPEVGDIGGDRSVVGLTREGARIELRIGAADLTALRAGMGTWLSLLGVAEAVDDPNRSG